jgi:ribosome-binding factor A
MSISTGVMKYNESRNSISYKIMCDCSDDDCTTTLIVSCDEDLMNITFYKKFYFFYKSMHPDKILDIIIDKYKSIKWRIKSAIKILFVGYIELETDIVFSNVDHIDNLIESVTNCREFYVNGVKK